MRGMASTFGGTGRKVRRLALFPAWPGQACSGVRSGRVASRSAAVNRRDTAMTRRTAGSGAAATRRAAGVGPGRVASPRARGLGPPPVHQRSRRPRRLPDLPRAGIRPPPPPASPRRPAAAPRSASPPPAPRRTFLMPISCATFGLTSTTRPSTNGPRSSIFTVADLPLRKFMTVAVVPEGQRLAGGDVGVRVHALAVRHPVIGEARPVPGRMPGLLAPGVVDPGSPVRRDRWQPVQLFGFAPGGRGESGGGTRGERAGGRNSHKEHSQYSKAILGHLPSRMLARQGTQRRRRSSRRQRGVNAWYHQSKVTAALRVRYRALGRGAAWHRAGLCSIFLDFASAPS